MSAKVELKDLPDHFRDKVTMGKFVGKKFHPKLVGFVAEVAHAFPEYTYTAKDTHGWGDNECVGKVAVYSKNQMVGSLMVETRYSRGDGNSDVYAVTCDGLTSRRSSMSTKHLKIAMKAVKENFKPMPIDQRAADMKEQLTHKLSRMLHNADNNVSVITNSHSTAILNFLAEYADMQPKPDKLPVHLETKLGREWRDKLNDYRIANEVLKRFKADQGVCIRIESDGALSTYDLATTEFKEHKSTYDLPTNYQEKITMLKLMEETQPIEHVGVWFEITNYNHGSSALYKYFFLVAGETYTDC